MLEAEREGALEIKEGCALVIGGVIKKALRAAVVVGGKVG